MTDRSVTVALRAFNHDYDAAMLRSAALTKTFSRELDHYAGRLKMWAELGAAIGPSLVPIGAVGVPAVAGLASELGFAAIAGGTLLASMQGVGGSLKALNSYSLSPTDANLKRVHATMARLSVEGQEFVLTLRDSVPLLRQIRDAGASQNITGPMGRGTEGLFIHLTRAMDDLDTMAPKVERVFRRISEMNGELIETGVENLTQERWADFFKFIAREGPDAVEALAGTVGHLVHGLAELWMAFEPLNDDVSRILLDGAADFDKWAEGLSKTRGFKDFVAYIEANGPQVGATLGAIADAVLKILEGFAPIGSEVLVVLEKFAQVIATIAGSDIGAPLLAGVAAMAALSRATVIFNSTRTGAFGATARLLVTGYSQAVEDAHATLVKSSERLAKAEAKVTSSMRQGRDEKGRFVALTQQQTDARAKYTATVVAATKAEAKAQKEMAAAQAKADAARRSAAIKGAALAGALALASTGVTESLGLEQTAMLGIAGVMVGGPWGGAVGAGIGFMKDFSDANRDASAAVEEFGRLLDDNSFNIADYKGAVIEAAQAMKQVDASPMSNFVQQMHDLANNIPIPQVPQVDTFLPDIFDNGGGGPGPEEQTKKQNEAIKADYLALELSLNQMRMTFRGEKGFPFLVDKNFTHDIGELQHIANRAQPAMEALGITFQDLKNATAEGRMGFAEQINDWLIHADTGAGRAEAVAKAIAEIGDESESVVDKVGALGDALDAALDPHLDLSAATDAWRVALRELPQNLSDSGKRLKGFTKDATDNREVIRDLVGKYKDIITTSAMTGASAEELATKLRNGKQVILDIGEAAGLSRPALKGLLIELGLTPKFVRTVFKQVGLDKGKKDAEDYKGKLKDIPKVTRTEAGFDDETAIRKLGRFAEKVKHPGGKGGKSVLQLELDDTAYYRKLQAAQERAEAFARTKVKPKITVDSTGAIRKLGNLQEHLDAAGRSHVDPEIDADTGGAMTRLATMQHYIDNMHGNTLTITTLMKTVKVGHAAGGLISGPGTGTSDSIDARLSNGEYVMRAGAVAKYGTAMFDRLNYASGGPVGTGGGGHDAIGLLAKILAALTGSDMGPGAVRGFMKQLDELRRQVAKHNRAIAEYNKKVAAWNKAHPDEDPHKFRKGGWTDELRDQAHDLFKEIREAEKDRAREIRQAFRSFDTDLSDGGQAVRDAMVQLKHDLREAGGVWNKELRQHAHWILELSRRYDASAAALEAQNTTLETLTSTSEDLASKWQSMADTVSGNFSSDLFTSGLGGGGLGGFYRAATKDTQQASMFQDVLQQLSAMGLDGPAFQALAESGDLKTAIQLLNSGDVGSFESAYGNRATALGSLGSYASDQVFGQQIANNNAQIAQQNILIADTQATMARLQKAVEQQEAVLMELSGLGDRVQGGAHWGTYWGAKEGIAGVASSAGQRIAMGSGPNWQQAWG